MKFTKKQKIQMPTILYKVHIVMETEILPSSIITTWTQKKIPS